MSREIRQSCGRVWRGLGGRRRRKKEDGGNYLLPRPSLWPPRAPYERCIRARALVWDAVLRSGANLLKHVHTSYERRIRARALVRDAVLFWSSCFYTGRKCGIRVLIRARALVWDAVLGSGPSCCFRQRPYDRAYEQLALVPHAVLRSVAFWLFSLALPTLHTTAHDP